MRSVEGIARIAEFGSLIPGVGAPFAVIAAAIRLGQGNYGDAALDSAALIPLGGIVGKVAKGAKVTEEIATGIKAANELGKAGEVAAGITGAKKAIQVGGRNLFPDLVTDFALTEVKNVKSLSFTRQLRDYAAYATQGPKKLDFILVTRPGTKLSGPLRKAIEDGVIIHKPTLPF